MPRGVAGKLPAAAAPAGEEPEQFLCCQLMNGMLGCQLPAHHEGDHDLGLPRPPRPRKVAGGVPSRAGARRRRRPRAPAPAAAASSAAPAAPVWAFLADSIYTVLDDDGPQKKRARPEASPASEAPAKKRRARARRGAGGRVVLRGAGGRAAAAAAAAAAASTAARAGSGGQGQGQGAGSGARGGEAEAALLGPRRGVAVRRHPKTN